MRLANPRKLKLPVRDGLKKDLQICGVGRKSRKRPTLFVGKKSNGKSQLTTDLRLRLLSDTQTIRA
jgi:hypothetical protein